MFGLTGFYKIQGGGGGIGDSRALSKEGEEADNVDIRQWILADDCDVGHQMYIIVSLVLSEKSGQDDSNESDSDEV
jgi:hypothetical protein